MRSISRRSRPKPLVAFTCGDPAGIGPRAVIRALKGPALRSKLTPLLIGAPSIWKRAGWSSGLAKIFPPLEVKSLPPLGRPSAESGWLSFQAVRLSCRLALKGLVDAVVTAPISKTAWGLAGIPFADHTDYLAAATGGKDVRMILGLPERHLWCVLATRHIPLNRVEKSLSRGAVLNSCLSLNAALKSLSRAKPRIGLCALNPHAGEGGRLGGAEHEILAPAVLAARRKGLTIEGPLPADSAWRLHAEGILDGLVCLYHDQALIPLKTLGGLSGINWTVGIPFIRTSPAHGTAFDKASSRDIDSSGTVAAAMLAVRLSKLENGE